MTPNDKRNFLLYHPLLNGLFDETILNMSDEQIDNLYERYHKLLGKLEMAQKFKKIRELTALTEEVGGYKKE